MIKRKATLSFIRLTNQPNTNHPREVSIAGGCDGRLAAIGSCLLAVFEQTSGPTSQWHPSSSARLQSQTSTICRHHISIVIRLLQSNKTDHTNSYIWSHWFPRSSRHRSPTDPQSYARFPERSWRFSTLENGNRGWQRAKSTRLDYLALKKTEEATPLSPAWIRISFSPFQQMSENTFPILLRRPLHYFWKLTFAKKMTAFLRN